jgi:hypothetical protein
LRSGKALERAQQYQQVIDNFPKLSQTLRAQLNNLRDEPREVPAGMTSDALNQEILQVSSQLLEPRQAAGAGARVKLPTRSTSFRSSKPMPAASSMKLSAASARKPAIRRRRRRKILACRRNLRA